MIEKQIERKGLVSILVFAIFLNILFLEDNVYQSYKIQNPNSLMGNITKYCKQDENKAITSFESNHLPPLPDNNQKLVLPERSKTVQNIYKYFIQDKTLQFSIENKKQSYNPQRFSIFGQPGIYVGQIKNNRPHGPGQIYFNNGNYLEAMFNQGQIQSYDAVFIQKNGNSYRGGFKQSAQTGIGMMRASGQFYKGRFSRGRLEGRGSLEFEDGRKYTGSFKKGKIEGKGKLIQKNGEVYQGYFKQGKKNGIGFLKTESYEYYGPFENDMKQGKGSLFLPNGQKFEGWFQKDEIYGYGQRHFKNGKVQKKVFKRTNISQLFN